MRKGFQYSLYYGSSVVGNSHKIVAHLDIPFTSRIEFFVYGILSSQELRGQGPT
jgi:hypothetical protein